MRKLDVRKHRKWAEVDIDLPTTGQIPLPTPRLSTRQAAEYTGLAESTLRYYRHAGTGPASYTIGSKVYYDLDDLNAWLSAQKAATLRGGAL